MFAVPLSLQLVETIRYIVPEYVRTKAGILFLKARQEKTQSVAQIT